MHLVKFSEENMLTKYKNLIYSIEESPIYFKRYILPYTEKQVVGLKKVLSDYSDKNIVEILSELADVEENYYSLMNGTNYNTTTFLHLFLASSLFSLIIICSFQYKIYYLFLLLISRKTCTSMIYNVLHHIIRLPCTYQCL